MNNYKYCKTALDALIQYQSTVRQIIISESDGLKIRDKLLDNDQAFLDYLTGRVKNADSSVSQEI